MLHRAAGLAPSELSAIADLERRVVVADGGRLKLEHATLSSRSGEAVEDLLWWEGGVLLGFCGLYVFGGDAEVAGMVDPTARRRGIGGALLDAALALCAQRGRHHALLVVPSTGAGGEDLARSRGGVPHHGEHALVLTGEPVPPPLGHPGLAVRRAGRADADAVLALLASGFGEGRTPDGWPARLDGDAEPTYLVEDGAAPVATLRVQRHGDGAGVYSFVVAEHLRGRGIGRAVLARVCSDLLADGAARVHLEVDVANENALGLYTSLGFEPVAGEDYLAVPTAPAAH